MTNLGSTRITPTIAEHVLWHFGQGGMEPGQFVKALIDAAAKADPTNRDRLGLGFPGYVRAVEIAQDTPTGIGELRVVVTPRPSITCPNCQRTSYHPEDVRYGYCGGCHNYTSPPYGLAEAGPVGVRDIPVRFCERCQSHVATVTWRGDDHVVVRTADLVVGEPTVDQETNMARVPVWAPAELTWCSLVDWEATRVDH